MSFLAIQKLQRKSAGPGAPLRAPISVYNVLNSPGKPLEKSTRHSLESGFNYDFSRVRVHDDARAAESARAVNAAAYAVGNHLVFDHGKYEPQNPRGQELLAHELTHTVQQRHAAPTGRLEVAPDSDASEREAASVSAAMLRRGEAGSIAARPAAVQRQTNPLPPVPHYDLGQSLAENASPVMAATLGSVNIDGFETGKDEISPANRAKLASTAEVIKTMLRKYPGSKIHVIGHTDAIGKEDDNQALGQRRANSVQAALAGLGLPPDAIDTESKGENDPAVKTRNAEPRNRRVEVRFRPETRFAGVLPDVSLKPPGSPPDKSAMPPSIFKPDLGLPSGPIPPPHGPVSPTPQLPDWMWKPLPPAPAKQGFSLEGGISSLAKKITSFLPESIRGKAADLVKDAIEKGITSGLDSALQGAGVDDKGRQAIGKAAEAAIKQKFGGNQ